MLRAPGRSKGLGGGLARGERGGARANFRVFISFKKKKKQQNSKSKRTGDNKGGVISMTCGACVPSTHYQIPRCKNAAPAHISRKTRVSIRLLL